MRSKSKATTAELVDGARQKIAQELINHADGLAMHVAYATNRHVWLKVREKIMAFGTEQGWKTNLIAAELEDYAARSYTPNIVQVITHCGWGNPYITETKILAEWSGCTYTDMSAYAAATKALGERAASQLIQLMTGMTKWDDFSYLFHFYPQIRPLFKAYGDIDSHLRSFRRPPRKLPSWLTQQPPTGDLLSLCIQLQAANLL